VHELVTRLLAKGLGTSAWAGPQSRAPSFWGERLPVGPLVAAAPDERDAADPWGLGSTSATQGARALQSEPASLSLYDLPGVISELHTRDAGELSTLAPTPSATGSHAEQGRTPAARTRALAQVKRLYIVAESEHGLAIIDQHAADERIQYDRLRRQFAARSVVVQRLLLPERVELSAREAALVESHGEEIARAGVEVALIGPDTAAVHAVPAILRRASPERLLRDLLDELSRAGDRGFGDAIDTALATMACHGAIRAGDALSLEECQALLDGIARIDEFGGHCPHGRPILLELPFGELARRVGR